MRGTDVRTDAADVLRRCQMPEDEIRWVLTAGDPAVIHITLELHRERLEEGLAERRNALGDLEARLTERAIQGESAGLNQVNTSSKRAHPASRTHCSAGRPAPR